MTSKFELDNMRELEIQQNRNTANRNRKCRSRVINPCTGIKTKKREIEMTHRRSDKNDNDQSQQHERHNHQADRPIFEIQQRLDSAGLIHERGQIEKAQH